MNCVVIHWEVERETAFGGCATCKTSANELRHESTNAGTTEEERSGEITGMSLRLYSIE